MTACERCSGAVLTVWGDTACMMCGHVPSEPVHPRAVPEAAPPKPSNAGRAGHTAMRQKTDAWQRFGEEPILPGRREYVEAGG